MDNTQAKQAPAEVEVTLRHPDFDDYAFRAEEGDVPHVIEDHIAAARAATTKRKAVADIDAKQAKLVGDIAQAEKRVDAARMLEDSAAIERETEAKEALEAQSSALVGARARLVDA